MSRTALMAAVLLAGCGPLADSPTAPTASPSEIAFVSVGGACPVTLAFQRPPDEVIDWARSGSNPPMTHDEAVDAAKRTNWAGAHGIWIPLPNDGVVPWGSSASGRKFPLWSLALGRASATARRLDAPTPAGFKAELGTPEQGYGPPGLIATGLTFPSRGCWEVTYRVDEASLTFVVDVRRQ